MAQFWSVNQIVNQAAVEVGLAPVSDVVSTNDPAFQSFVYLLTSAGQELLRMAKWETLLGEFSITTQIGDTGNYPLPDDWGYMIPQTHWNHTDALPLFGPLTAQDWQYLEGRGLVTTTIYASFRLRRGQISIFPNDPVPDNKTLVMEYVRNTWLSNATGTEFYDAVQQSNDVVLYPPILAKAFVKVKFLEAKGFDSTKARDDFAELLDQTMGQDKGAPKLNQGGAGRTFPYLDSWYNTPDTGYGRA